MRRSLLIAAGGILLGALASLYALWWVPNRLMVNESWWNTSSNAEKLRVSHRVLSLPFGNHHDAALTVFGLGDCDSVAPLMRALRWDAIGGDEDSRGHIVEALTMLTGARPGTTYADWSRYFNEHPPKVSCHPPPPGSRKHSKSHAGGSELK